MERVKLTDRIRNKAVLERVDEEIMMLKLIRKRKRNWLGRWLRRNCLLKDALEGMLSAPVYRPMLQYSWQSASYVNREKVSDFKNVIQVTFDFSAQECGSEDCSDGKNYFGQLLYVHMLNKNDQDDIRIQFSEPFILEPTLSEVDIAMQKLKKCKSPGIDKISAELIQEGGNALSSEIYEFVLAFSPESPKGRDALGYDDDDNNDDDDDDMLLG
ncbi:hypothetical protein ANN_09216 [Periplaneta americana]|uniref:Uncharacterized protein n=1 Tax=Periplaneta americana TaxID=6978 RepID=A0ABQ8TMV3_PERAM|nr:hypothetical protein ANN_09216 [Periplaneta americana]